MGPGPNARESHQRRLTGCCNMSYASCFELRRHIPAKLRLVSIKTLLFQNRVPLSSTDLGSQGQNTRYMAGMYTDCVATVVWSVKSSERNRRRVLHPIPSSDRSESIALVRISVNTVGSHSTKRCSQRRSWQKIRDGNSHSKTSESLNQALESTDDRPTPPVVSCYFNDSFACAVELHETSRSCEVESQKNQEWGLSVVSHQPPRFHGPGLRLFHTSIVVVSSPDFFIPRKR